MTLQVKAGATRAIKHMDLRGVTDSEQRATQRHGVVDTQGAHLGLGGRHV
jgi:hypothetical protein